MQDPLQRLEEEEDDALDELLFLLHLHGQHLETFLTYFANVNEYLAHGIVDLPGPAEMSQLDAFVDGFDRVVRLQDQISNALLAIAVRLEHLTNRLL